jgi:hypothetical protein
MSEFKVNTITNRDGSYGPQVCGITTFGGSGMQLPSGPTEMRGGRGRGIVAGGYNPYTDTINKFEIATTGNAIDFGNLNQALRGPSNGVSSSTRGLFAGGLGPGQASKSVITYVTISSEGGANDYGDLTRARFMINGHSNNTRGIFTGGYTTTSPAEHVETIDYVNIASTGNATSFGEIQSVSGNKWSTFGSGSSPTRGVFGGGYYGSPGTDVANINFITISTLGNSETFGSLTAARRDVGGLSSSTRAIFAGGTNAPGDPNSTNIIDYVTIATLGNATDFGDMTEGGRNRPGCASNSIRGTFSGGRISGSGVDSISFLTIATTGNTADFGDLTYSLYELGGFSDTHGGLAQ